MSTPTLDRPPTHTLPMRRMPRELDLHEVGGLLDGSLTPQDVLARPSRLAVDAPQPTRRGTHLDTVFGPQHTTTAALPDARVWTYRFALALVESLAGRRPPAQLAPHTTSDVLARIQRRHRTTLRRGAAVGLTDVRRVRVCLPRDGVVEAAVVAHVNGRPTPIALRLNGMDGRWRVTVLEAL